MQAPRPCRCSCRSSHALRHARRAGRARRTGALEQLASDQRSRGRASRSTQRGCGRVAGVDRSASQRDERSPPSAAERRARARVSAEVADAAAAPCACSAVSCLSRRCSEHRRARQASLTPATIASRQDAAPSADARGTAGSAADASRRDERRSASPSTRRGREELEAGERAAPPGSRASSRRSSPSSATPTRPIAATSVPSARRGERRQPARSGGRSAREQRPPDDAAYAVAAPRTAPNARISRLSHDVRRPSTARNAYSGRPRWNTLAPERQQADRAARRPRGTRRAAASCAEQRPQPASVDDERADRELRQHEHHDQRQVRVRGAHVVEVGRQQVARERRSVRYTVVGSVIAGDGAPGRNASRLRVLERPARCRRCWIAIASFGHACTQAGASPAASRSLHMSHLRTMPRFALYCGTSYGQVSVQYWQPMHWSSRWLDDAGDRILLVRVHRAAVHARRDRGSGGRRW